VGQKWARRRRRGRRGCLATVSSGPQQAGSSTRGLTTDPAEAVVGEWPEWLDDEGQRPDGLWSSHLICRASSQVHQGRRSEDDLDRSGDDDRFLLCRGEVTPPLLRSVHGRPSVSCRPAPQGIAQLRRPAAAGDASGANDPEPSGNGSAEPCDATTRRSRAEPCREDGPTADRRTCAARRRTRKPGTSKTAARQGLRRTRCRSPRWGREHARRAVRTRGRSRPRG
jgi:hypothetical protein